MTFSDQRPTNWGCFVAAVVVIPLAFFVFLIGSMGSGGCEGAPTPSEVDYTPMWIMMGGLVVVGLLIAKTIKALVGWSSKRRRD